MAAVKKVQIDMAAAIPSTEEALHSRGRCHCCHAVADGHRSSHGSFPGQPANLLREIDRPVAAVMLKILNFRRSER